MDGESLRRLQARFEPHYRTTPWFEKKKDPAQLTSEKAGSSSEQKKDMSSQAAVYKAFWKMAKKKAKLYRDVMVAKKKAEYWEKRAVKAEKALEDVKKAMNVVGRGISSDDQ